MFADVFLDHDRDEKFHRFEAHPIHLRRDRQHRPRSHAQCPETLLPIAQCGIDEMNLTHAKILECWSTGWMESWELKPTTPSLHSTFLQAFPARALLRSNNPRAWFYRWMLPVCRRKSSS